MTGVGACNEVVVYGKDPV